MNKFFAMMLGLSLTASAYGAGTAPKAAKPAKQAKTVAAAPAGKIDRNRFDQQIPNDPAVTIGVLDNGIKYYIRENKKPENKAELQIVVKAGSVQEDNDQAGLAHFIEHMCFNGTKNFPKDQLVKFLESTGIRFGADLNANTGFDRTLYLLTIPLDKPGMLEQGMQVLEDWAHNVSFDEDEIEKERGVIMSEWLVYRGVGDRAQKKHIPVMLAGSKFADRLPIGDTAVIKHAPRQRFIDFYKDWYRPDLTAVIAVGDFKKDDIEKLIKKHFAGIQAPAKIKPREEYPIPGNKEPKVSIFQDKEMSMTQISVMWKHPGRANGTYGSYRANLVDNLAEIMLSLRMQEKSRDAKPPFLYAGAGSGEFLAGLRAFNVISVPKEDDIMTGYEAALTEAYRAHKHGFTKGELEVAKKQVMRGIESSLAEKDKTESSTYASEYYRNYYEGEAFPGIEVEAELYKEYVPAITLEEINKVMKSYMTEENMIITVTAPEKEGLKLPSEQEFLASLNKVKNSTIEPYADFSSDKPLMTKKPKAGKITAKKENKEFGIHEWTLSNGAKVILKPTDFQNDEVLFKAWSLGGTSLASDEVFASARFADNIIDEAGLSEYTANQLQKMLAGKQCGVSPSIGELTEGLDGSASPKDLETFFQMLNLYFTAPRKDADAFSSSMTKIKEQIRSSKRSPESLFSDSLNAVLYNHHPRYMPITDKDVRKVDLDKAYEFYKERFADAGDFKFVFVGSFDLKTIQPYIETYIASLPTKNVKENFKDLGVSYVKGNVEKEVKKGIEPKSTVRMVINGDFDYTPANLMALNSMMEVFSIRLREVIREEKGGVYGIGAFPRISKYPTPRYTANIAFGTSPDRVKELVQDVHNVINELKNAPARDEDVTKVREIMKNEFKTNSKENRFWLNSIYSSEFNGLDINRLKNYEKMVDGITAQSIQAAAVKYLDTKNLLKVLLNPEDGE